jgi:alpha-tubulin suppressor-like RCC1 family protein
VRCWGYNNYNQLGYSSTESVGDNETPDSVAEVDVGDTVERIVGGTYHTCALTTSSEVRCWGYAGYGSLGYGNTEQIGDNEAPSAAGTVLLL